MAQIHFPLASGSEPDTTVAITSGVAGVDVQSLDLYNYVLAGKYDLPLAGGLDTSELASEASAVTYNWDTDTLFVVGDEATAIVQISKTGQLIDSMNLPAGVDALEDTEGLAYLGNGQFVVVEERTRTAVLFTYTAGTTLTAQDTEQVVLGTNAGNLGLEGVAIDPLSDDPTDGAGFVFVKENAPQGLFQTNIDFAAGTASNGSAVTENSANLFDPALLGLIDVADLFALSLLPSTAGYSLADNILVLSQESGRIVEVDRDDGTILSALDIAPGTGSVADQGHEGVTVDRDGNLYLVSEQGGGADTPQLWVYRLADFANAAPTGIALQNALSQIDENGDTTTRIKVADVFVADDGIGQNLLSLSGADTAFFEVDSTGLYLKAGTVLDFETKPDYAVTVAVDDPSIGATPDASTGYTLAVNDLVNESGVPVAFISEVAPWSSGSKNSPVGEDWFELTNTGDTPLDISGWRFDDDSASFAESDPLLGITSIAPGESVIFLNTADLSGVQTKFIANWFGGSAPAGLQFGNYEGAGLGTSGDGITLFDDAGKVQTSLAIGISPGASPFATFDNSPAVAGSEIDLLSADGVAGAFTIVNTLGRTEIGSPGTVGKVFISEVAPWSSGSKNSPVGEDWFEISNTTAVTVDITGWRFDDDSASFADSDPLLGVTSIAPGESVIFLNTADLSGVQTKFIDTWFGGKAPAGLHFGNYEGAGLSTSGDAITLFDAAGNPLTGVSFGASPTAPDLATFDNAAALEFAPVTTLSTSGSNGAFSVSNSFKNIETGSPGAIVTVAASVANDDAFTTDEITVLIDDVTLDNGNGADSGPGGAITITQVMGEAANVGTQITLASGALLTLAADGTFSYDANGAFDALNKGASDTDTFAYTVAGGDTATVTVSVEGVNQVLVGNDKANAITGSDGIETIDGLGGDDTLTGLGDDDILDGGTGVDAMAGGAGNDTYIVDNAGDTLIENPLAGFDWVFSSVGFALRDHGQNLERLTLTGTDDIGGTGNALANRIAGNIGNNLLNGGSGNDVLIGGYGNDTLRDDSGADAMIGGFGNDTYYVDNAGDTIVENQMEGFDRLFSSISVALRDLSQNLEHLTLTGTAAINGTGNALANRITGNEGVNVLDGAGGDDVLIGGGGNDFFLDNEGGSDTFTGGSGADSFRFFDGFGKAIITDFAIATAGEQIVLAGVSAITDFADLQANHLSQVDADAVIADGFGGAITLLGVNAGDLTASHFAF